MDSKMPTRMNLRFADIADAKLIARERVMHFVR